MRKLRVVHYCNQLSLGGTERTMEIFCRYLDRSRFDVYAVSRLHRESLVRRARVELGARLGLTASKGKKALWAAMNARIPNFRNLLGDDRVILARDEEELRDAILILKPDILHVHYSGNPEPPTSDEEILSRIPVTVTTNQFERHNTAAAHRHVRRMLFVSRWLLDHKATWAAGDPRADILYNPIEPPASRENLRTALGIPADAFVIGRCGRPDPGIHDPIALRAYERIQDGNTYFLALSPPENMRRQAKDLGLRNFMALTPSADAEFLSRFYNTLDVLAHARRDGETFGCNIGEAMRHGKPVVSHRTPYMNAQEEVIGDAGYVCAQDDWENYARRLALLRENPAHRADLSNRAQARAAEHFDAAKLTRRLENVYLDLLNERAGPKGTGPGVL